MKEINLNKYSKLGLGLLLGLCLLGYAGTADRVEQIIYQMDDSTYYEIKEKLSSDGCTASDRQIADYYIKNYSNK